DRMAALPEDGTFDYHVAGQVHGLLIDVAFEAGDIETAALHVQGQLDLATRWAHVDRSPEARYWLGISHDMKGIALALTGDPERAAREHREALAILAALSAEHPTHAAYRREAWFTRTLLAMSLAGGGDTRIWVPRT